MAAVRIALLVFVLVAATPVRAESVDRWRPYIAEASARTGVPVEWIERVMRAESGGRTTLNGRPIISSAGAMGLMQLMPGTWADMRARLGLGNDPHHPRDNILAGTYYLRLMYDRFGYPGLFGAYNAGPARYSAYLAGRSNLPSETRGYLEATAGTRSAERIGRQPSDGLWRDVFVGRAHNAVHQSQRAFLADEKMAAHNTESNGPVRLFLIQPRHGSEP
ncbi:lytic transglycosylase domain-containing protein [Sphingopyxis granuli]|uniref:lytic transglycosylase domain-containing protein n=1 Tax=Sphingopyxis granuli TaxID=267128 RepID=UPI0009ED613C|nr:lytic transglycosylase domain-containing protein [Sphingopyxis granuli]